MTNNIIYDDVLNFLINLVSAKTGASANEISANAALGDLNLDSLDVLDLTFEAELKYEINFPNEAAGLANLKDVADLTFKLINDKS